MPRPARLSVLVVVFLTLELCIRARAAEITCPPSVVVPTQAELAQAGRNARDHGALWRFEKDGRAGYLYGTIHIANLEWAMPGPTIRRALRDAETVAIEADPGNPATGAGMAAPQKPHEAPSLPPKLLDRLRAQAARACEPWESLEAMPPLMMVTRLTLLDARWDGLHTDYSIEAVLASFARKTGKNLATLETVAIQRAALVAGSPAEQAVEVEQRLMAVENGSAPRRGSRWNGWRARATRPSPRASKSCIVTAGASLRRRACCTWSAARRCRSSWLSGASRSSACRSAAADIRSGRGARVDRDHPRGARCQSWSAPS